MPIEYYTTDQLTGESGEVDRVLTLNNNIMTLEHTTKVWLDGTELTEGSGFKVYHKEEDTEVKFLNAVDDGQEISVNYEIRYTKHFRLWEKEIDYHGEWILIKRVYAKKTTEWGDEKRFTKEIKVKAIADIEDFGSDFEEEGEMYKNFSKFYIKPGSKINRGDFIKHFDKWFEIDDYHERRAHNIRVIEIFAENA